MEESDFMQYLTIKEWRNSNLFKCNLKTTYAMLYSLFTKYCVKNDSCLASVNKYLHLVKFKA